MDVSRRMRRVPSVWGVRGGVTTMVAMAALCVSAPAWTQEAPPALAGVVVDTGGVGVASADVRVVGTLIRTYSETDSRFHFARDGREGIAGVLSRARCARA
jgi:hypothetical protein